MNDYGGYGHHDLAYERKQAALRKQNAKAKASYAKARKKRK